MSEHVQPNPSNAGLKRVLLAAYVFGVGGTGTELLLMEHTEGIWQQIPVILIGLSIPLFVWQWLSQKRVASIFFQIMMAAFALSGMLGTWLHFSGKAEFKLEIEPELSGWALFWECMYGHSMPPVLAPGSMILLALVGLACVKSGSANSNNNLGIKNK
jgi:hypothetical protein